MCLWFYWSTLLTQYNYSIMIDSGIGQGTLSYSSQSLIWRENGLMFSVPPITDLVLSGGYFSDLHGLWLYMMWKTPMVQWLDHCALKSSLCVRFVVMPVLYGCFRRGPSLSRIWKVHPELRLDNWTRYFLCEIYREWGKMKPHTVNWNW